MRWPAIAQSILPVDLSTRRSTYQPSNDRTMVSVFSNAGSGTQRREIRVERLLLLVWPVVIVEGKVWELLVVTDNGVVQLLILELAVCCEHSH